MRKQNGKSLKRSPRTVVLAGLFTFLMLAFGIASFGIITTFIFAFGFLGGYILWLLVPTRAAYQSLKVPYWLTLAAFIFLHRVEENVMKFQVELSKITGRPVPELDSFGLIALLIVTVGAWLLVLPLVKRGYDFGYFLAWTFFASMGLTELAHYVFPLFQDKSYGYFPGMASVVVLAPLAWCGMFRLWKGRVPR